MVCPNLALLQAEGNPMHRLMPFAVLPCFLAGAAVACPDPNQRGQTYNLDLTSRDLLSGLSFDVVAGGDSSLAACGFATDGAPTQGSVTTPPDFTFNLSGTGVSYLNLRVVSECDAVLLIYDDQFQAWSYDDDSNGNYDPALATLATQGQLNVWVGTYDGAFCDATLTLQATKLD